MEQINNLETAESVGKKLEALEMEVMAMGFSFTDRIRAKKPPTPDEQNVLFLLQEQLKILQKTYSDMQKRAKIDGRKDVTTPEFDQAVSRRIQDMKSTIGDITQTVK